MMLSSEPQWLLIKNLYGSFCSVLVKPVEGVDNQ